MVHKTQQTANVKVIIVFSFSPPMTVVKQSPFSLVPKLGYVRNYAVSMTCFTLLLVCPEVSYSSKHNHFFQALHWSRNKIGVHLESVCSFQLVISSFFYFLTLFSQSMRIKLSLASTVLLLILCVFSFFYRNTFSSFTFIVSL